MTKAEILSAVSRIERLPNVTLLMRAVDAVLGSNAMGIVRIGARWEVSEDGYAMYQADFATVRRRLASYVTDAYSCDEEDEPAEQAAPAMISQPVQLQQACAVPAETAVEVAAPEAAPALDPTTIEGIRALLIGRSAVIEMPMGEVTYRIVDVRRWTSPDGAQVRDYVDFEDEGVSRDDRKEPKSIHIVRAGTSRGVKHDSPVGQVRYSYGRLCNSGAKEARTDTLIEELFAVKFDGRG